MKKGVDLAYHLCYIVYITLKKGLLMKRIVKILMERDGLTKEEAISQTATFFREMSEDIATGGDPFEWEDNFMSEFGLEPDFFEDLLFRLA